MKVTGSYLGRSGRYAQGRNLSNPYSDVWLNVQKSAEAVVPRRGMTLKKGVRAEREGLNNGGLTSERSV